ncbi:arginine--tRNA ligase [Agrococcus versicolor]|uniref:Arginine--tRNA ligase n=1 Tax=Agrococcus versicolor TaxID=501482 RepID=A0ABP5MML3_9MICO
MHPAALADALLTCVQDVVGERAEVSAADIVLERPRSREHGDWTTNAAMRLAKRVGVAPRDLAAQLQERIATIPGVSGVEVAGPGFLNLRLDAAAAGELARTVVEAGGAYGRGDALQGVAMNLEFVSANPTGPMHLGGARWAAVGDSLARILESQGARVTREYYFNDHGAQIDRFARSLVAAWRGQPTPEDGYGGAYIADIARRVEAESEIDMLDLDDDALQEHFRAAGVQMMFGEIKQELADFGVVFDVYFHEHDVQANGDVERAIERLRERGHVFEQEGAIWLRTTDFGDDRDRVVVRSNGEPAYFSGDLAYYLNKRDRGFDQCLILLGADHHGYVGRLMAMCEAFGDEPGVNLQVLIGQLVNLVRDGKPVRMSKRAGTIVTMEDLVEAVGVDAARYALARSSVDSPLDIDLALLQKRSNDNPVFYVQYAHARTSAVARNAAAAGVDRSAFDAATLDHPTEAALLGALADFPRVLAQAAQLREPHRIARFAEELAGLYHRWYDACRVVPVGDDAIGDRNRSRLWLNDATGQVLRTALGHLGVSAPERM